MITLEYTPELEELSHIDCPEEYIKSVNASIYYVPDGIFRLKNDPPIEKQRVGSITWTYIYAKDMQKDRVPCWHMCSNHSYEASLLCGTLFDDDGRLHEAVEAMFNEEISHTVDFASIDFIEILPQFRGKRIGLKIMELVCRRVLNGAAIIAIQPGPIQFCNPNQEYVESMKLNDFVKDEKEAKKKLIKYYKKAGFKPLKGTEFMIYGQI